MIATMKNVHHVIKKTKKNKKKKQRKNYFIEHHIKCIHATFIAYKRYNSVTDKVILEKLKRAIIKGRDK